jgi:hypothetical protein
MKHSNCHIEGLWSGINFAWQTRGRRIPLYLQVAPRAPRAFLVQALERRI